MSLPVVLAEEAQVEFDEAFDWHETLAPPRGPAFEAAVRVVFDRIAAFPLIHAVVFKDVRKGVVSGFPYIVIYRPETDRVIILSVFNCRRDPAIWQRRV